MFKTVMIGCTVVSGVLTALFTGLHLLFPQAVSNAFAITFGTVFYHFAMRLAVGYGFDACLHNRVNYHAKWFAPLTFEKALYKRLHVKNWKAHMPTYSPQTFSMEDHSLEEIAGAMCQSELVHETIVVLSFLPLLAAIPFGEFLIFLITSLLAAAFDLSFVIMQRYNRPRVVRLIERQNRTL